MSTVYEVGYPSMLYDPARGASGFGTNLIIDASGEKAAFVGNVWHPTVRTGTIAIRKVHFRCGAITLNAASEVRVSLQDVSQTAGPPYQPDGTQDQTYDFKTATTALTANAWNNTGNLSADRTVNLASDSASDANPRRVAVVFEFQAFNASDSIIISCANHVGLSDQLAGVILNTGSWAALSNRGPVLAFECADGTFAFLQGGVPWSAVGNVTVGNAAAVRRAGVKFRFPTARSIDRAALSLRLANGADGRIVLYDSDGTTELRSIDYDNDDVLNATNDVYAEVVFEPVDLLANTDYRLAFVSTTATLAQANFVDVNVVALMDGLILGQNAYWTQHNGTAWSDTTTRRLSFGLGVCGYNVGSLLLNSGMQGGLRG